MTGEAMSCDDLFTQPLRVVNIGLEGFAEELRGAGIEVVHLDWRPPSGGDPRMAALLASLEDEE
jgi:FdrA protein